MKKNMVMSKLIYFAVALALLGSLVVVGCAPKEAPTAPTAPTVPPPVSTAPTAPIAPTTPTAPTLQPQYGGTLRFSNPAGPYQICFPAAMYSTHDYKPYCASVDPIFKMDFAQNLIPCLATGYTTDYTAKTVTITLRKGVKFHDGTDYNAEVQKWNFEQFKLAAAAGSAFIKSIDIIDDYTLRINLSDWDSRFFTALGGQSMSGVYSKAAYEKNGKDWALKNCVAAGPFVLESWSNQVIAKYKKWDSYWVEGKPYLDAIEFICIADYVTAEMALRNGDIDMASMLQITSFDKLKQDGFIVQAGHFPSGVSPGLTPDSANPASPFVDIRVRQAACYAIDNKAIVDSIYKGVATVANQYAAYPEQFGHNPDVVGYPYNPTRAKELLVEAGYPTGFKTKLTNTTSVGETQTAVTATQAYLKAVGIDAEMELATPAKNMAQGIGGEKWVGLASAYTRTGNPDPLSCLIDSYSGPKARVMMAKPREWLMPW